jgi:hypothetical protein
MREYANHFDEVIFLKPDTEALLPPLGGFSPVDLALDYELCQIRTYLDLTLEDENVLLLCDLSFPGLFASVLYHKRPSRCFTICHGTSRNKHDYFADCRSSKWSVEGGHSELFEGVFVATEYHRRKLGWSNCHVVSFPLPRISELGDLHPSIVRAYRPSRIVSVARPGLQKVNLEVEQEIEEMTGSRIVRFHETGGRTWSDYYSFLRDADFLLVSSREETYGYQVIDALSVGTVPIAPRALSYPELLPARCLYEPGSAVDAVAVMERYPTCPALWEDTFIRDTARIMQA